MSKSHQRSDGAIVHLRNGLLGEHNGVVVVDVMGCQLGVKVIACATTWWCISNTHGISPLQVRLRVMIMGKLFANTCLCHQADNLVLA